MVVIQPCEMSCRFCPSGDVGRTVPTGHDHDRQFEDLVDQMEVARRLGVTVLEIGGNDVLLYPRAVELFRAAGEMGFRAVGAQSPGQRLGDAEFAEAVAGTGLTQVDLPIYGATAEEHERVTRAPGSFEGLCRAVDRVKGLGRPEVRLHTIALKSTLGRLGDLIEMGKERFGIDIHVELLRPNRVGEREHLSDAASLAEIASVAELYPGHFGGDVPLCAMPRERAFQLFGQRGRGDVFGRRLHLWDMGLREGSEDMLAMRDRRACFPAACEGCAVRAGCPGVLQAYVGELEQGVVGALSA
ncbi:MAG: radical SAM protein [Polyangiaceae bacterium]